MAKKSDALEPGTVRVKVLHGSLLYGESRIDKGHTFVTTEEYAAHLQKQFQGQFEIVRVSEKPETTETTIIEADNDNIV